MSFVRGMATTLPDEVGCLRGSMTEKQVEELAGDVLNQAVRGAFLHRHPLKTCQDPSHH